jgi:hypothetical protein
MNGILHFSLKKNLALLLKRSINKTRERLGLLQEAIQKCRILLLGDIKPLRIMDALPMNKQFEFTNTRQAQPERYFRSALIGDID